MDNFINTLENVNMWAAIVSAIAIIALGYILIKVKVFKADWKKVLNAVVLKVALPALAIKGFMAAITIHDLKVEGFVLGFSFGLYIVLVLIAELWIRFAPKIIMSKKKINQVALNGNIESTIVGEINTEGANKQRKDVVMWMMLIFGSTTFFGMPIINSVYPDGVLSANLANIPYRIFLYSYAFMMMSGLKMNKENIVSSMKKTFMNPIIIATFIGLILWLSQLIPGAGSWFVLKETAPYIYKPFFYIADLCSPLVWLSIGITLASQPLINAVKDWTVWMYCGLKNFGLPLIVFAILISCVSSNIINKASAMALVIFAATPPATVIIAYSMNYKNNEDFAARCSALSTLTAVIVMPVWIIIGETVYSMF